MSNAVPAISYDINDVSSSFYNMATLTYVVVHGFATFYSLQRMPHHKSVEKHGRCGDGDLWHLEHHADLLDEVDAFASSFALIGKWHSILY